MIRYQEDEIKRLKTENAYIEGYLHCRGIIQKCEQIYCTPTMLDKWSRRDRWIEMLETTMKGVTKVTPFKDSSTATLATQITSLYGTLCNRIHDSYGSSVKKLQINGLPVFDSQILAYVCDRIGILWESDVINQKYKKISKRKMEDASMRLNNTTCN